MPFPYAVTTFTGIVLWGLIIALLVPKVRAFVRMLFLFWPAATAVVCVITLSAVYLNYACFTVGVQENWWKVVVYLSAPFVLVALGQERKAGWLDAAGLLWVGLWFDFQWFGQRVTPKGYAKPYDWAVLALCSTLVVLLVWTVARCFEDRGLRVPDRRLLGRNLVRLFKYLLGYGLPLVAIGWATGFLPWQGLKHFTLIKLATSIGAVFISVALWEEVFFRGVVCAFLKRVFKDDEWRDGNVFLANAALFALWHMPRPMPAVLNNGSMSLWEFHMAYAVVAGFAGVTYLLLYRRSHSIVWAMALHAIFDGFVGTFFR